MNGITPEVGFGLIKCKYNHSFREFFFLQPERGSGSIYFKAFSP